jgi:hypothetical protein
MFYCNYSNSTKPIYALSHYALKLREDFGNKAKLKYQKKGNFKFYDGVEREGRAITAAKFLDPETIVSTESSSDEGSYDI